MNSSNRHNNNDHATHRQSSNCRHRTPTTSTTNLTPKMNCYHYGHERTISSP
jgi:hypothetical protein